MSELRKFLNASSHYMATQIAVLVASLISFPIIVRLLSVEDYGILSLCNTILLFGVAVSKLGLQNSIVRFYPEYLHRGELPCFFRTYTLTGVVAALVFFLITGVFTVWYLPDGYKNIAWLLAGSVLLQALFSYQSNFLRSQERTTFFAAVMIIVKYLSTFGGIALIYYLHMGLSGIFRAQVFFFGMLTIYLIGVYYRILRGGGAVFSISILRESILFGSPLIFFEVSSILLAFSDRFLILHFIGVKELGIYAVGYTMCMYLADLIRQPLNLALGPIYTRIFLQQGEDEAKKFLGNLIGVVALFALPIFAGCLAIREDLIVWLASSKYIEAAAILPWVLGALLVYSVQPVISAGLFLKKKTTTIAVISICCGLVNIILNVILLPRFGVIAAAWSTAFSYVISVILSSLISARQMRISPPWRTLAGYALSALVLFSLVTLMPSSIVLPLRIFAGVIIYFVTVISIDSNMRFQVGMLLQAKIAR